MKLNKERPPRPSKAEAAKEWNAVEDYYVETGIKDAPEYLKEVQDE